jgi:hypothetical protein
MNSCRVVMGVLLSACVLLGSSCSSDEWTCESTGVICAKNSSDVQACCNSGGTQCKYTVGTTDYLCDGTDCKSETNTVQSYCSSH